MTTDELKALIGQVIDMLRLNAQMASAQFLDTAQKAINKVKENPALQSVIAQALGTDLNAVATSLTSVETGLDIERKLTEGKTTEHIITVLQSVSERPLVLALIASFIKK